MLAGWLAYSVRLGVYECVCVFVCVCMYSRETERLGERVCEEKAEVV